MFYIDATFEDCRVQARSVDGTAYHLAVYDNHTGDGRETIVSALQLSYILQMNLHNNGEPEGFEKMYESLESLFVDWPNNLRPIP